MAFLALWAGSCGPSGANGPAPDGGAGTDAMALLDTPDVALAQADVPSSDLGFIADRIDATPGDAADSIDGAPGDALDAVGDSASVEDAGDDASDAERMPDVAVDVAADVAVDSPAATDAVPPRDVPCDGAVCGEACVDLWTSTSNCGACGIRCGSLPNASPVCRSAVCYTACDRDFADCDRSDTNGCEVDLRRSPDNCGACGTRCPGAPNASATCADGRCGFVCFVGYGDCDGNPANGCELSLAADPNNCNGCGARCMLAATVRNAAPICAAFSCAAACVSRYGDCDGNPANGCERPLGADLANCGACGRACGARDNATASCVEGNCTFQCQAGYGDCDGNPANGCEARLNANPNCGGCGVRCGTVANGSSACIASACAVESCDARFADCDHVAANGCEVRRESDPLNCGGCGVRCPAVTNATATCVSSRCGYTCNTGFGDCDNADTTGCEADLRTSPRACGACGRVCEVDQVCRAGVCVWP